MLQIGKNYFLNVRTVRYEFYELYHRWQYYNILFNHVIFSHSKPTSIGNDHSPIRICDEKENDDESTVDGDLDYKDSGNNQEDQRNLQANSNGINIEEKEERNEENILEKKGLTIAPCRRCIYYCNWIFGRCRRYPKYCWTVRKGWCWN